MEALQRKEVFVQCPQCGEETQKEYLEENRFICPQCKYYFSMAPLDRVSSLVDKGIYKEYYADMKSNNPLAFAGYEKKLQEYMEKTQRNEAVITVVGEIRGIKAVIVVMDAQFMMGSMGATVGEKITKSIEYATQNKYPIIIFTASGGARMQEGIFSLMQMAKTSGALAKHNEEKQLYISVLTHPTTGGVTASFAMLGDIILAEPAALIGFAGRRVIEQTIREKMPEDFQKSEYLLKNGMIDAIVEREKMKETIGKILELHKKNEVRRNLGQFVEINKQDYNEPKFKTKQPIDKNINKNEEISMENSWEIVRRARDLHRPKSRFYINEIVTDFIELHGDRLFGDDTAIIGGIGKIGNYAVTIIAHNKGSNLKENLCYNFGMAHPEGYRKALRLMKQAEKFNRPIISLIDTPGAYCGIGAEERGQGQAIAQNLMEMMRLRVPIIAGIIGEGGSGGALAIGVGDYVFMQQNTIYAILSPEGFASILWKDSHRAKEAASIMKLTPTDLLQYGIIDDILEEVENGEDGKKETAKILKDYMINKLKDVTQIHINDLIESRYDRFRAYGNLTE